MRCFCPTSNWLTIAVGQLSIKHGVCSGKLWQVRRTAARWAIQQACCTIQGYSMLFLAEVRHELELYPLQLKLKLLKWCFVLKNHPPKAENFCSVLEALKWLKLILMKPLPAATKSLSGGGDFHSYSGSWSPGPLTISWLPSSKLT